MKDLNYTIPRVNPTNTVKDKSKEIAETKSDNEQKKKIEIDDDCFMILQGIQHRLKKKLKSAEHVHIVKRILDRDLDPSGVLIDIVKV